MGLASTHISYHKRFGHKRILKDAEIPVIKEDLEKTNPIKSHVMMNFTK